MTAPDDLGALREKPFSECVSKFEDLLNQSGRAFLMGAGCSKCAGLPLTEELTNNVLGSAEIDETSRSILTAVRDQFEGSETAHIEDYLSELIDLLTISERRSERGATQEVVTLGEEERDASQLRVAVESIKRAIGAIVEKPISIEVHRSFTAAVHRPLRVGKTAPGQVVDYLVLNYDTALEDALALERVPFSDGIDGGVTGWWNPNSFDRDDLAARVLKLHGSIDWSEFAGDPLPRRISKSIDINGGSQRQVLIWPASTKYREAQLDPYAQLMERARRVLRPSRGSQRVLVVCGYAFGDTHINGEMDRALRESAGDLTIVVFTSENEPVGQMGVWNEDGGIRDQVLIFANRGFFHGDVCKTSEHDLLWWKFENITRLLQGQR